ncbi:unnamed protein product [Amaranthus hypochondriacus]
MASSLLPAPFLPLIITILVSVAGKEIEYGEKYPIVVSTWPFVEAVRAAWRAVDGGFPALDAVVEGCSACEELRCDGTVGPGGSPDENGETTLDALIMNGATMEIGAVAAMRHVKDGIRAARLVMQYTEHTLLVGEKASLFAISMGLPGPMNLSSEESLCKWNKWKENDCQPNFRKNVSPSNSCGPYYPNRDSDFSDTSCSSLNHMGTTIRKTSPVNIFNHDTISMAVIDKAGHVAAGTSTNGATSKIPGSYQVIESMRRGMLPKHAAEDAISRIAKKFPNFIGAVFALSKNGLHAGACHGWTFQYSVRVPSMDDVKVFTVTPQTASAHVP